MNLILISITYFLFLKIRYSITYFLFQKIRYLIWRYAELNRLIVGLGQIPIELKQDDYTVCCSHTVVEVGPSRDLYYIYLFTGFRFPCLISGLQAMGQPQCPHKSISKMLPLMLQIATSKVVNRFLKGWWYVLLVRPQRHLLICFKLTLQPLGWPA